METLIKKTAGQLSAVYYGFWGASLALFGAGELDLLPGGLLVGRDGLDYWLQTSVIFLTAAGIPGALKLFNWMLVRKAAQQDLSHALVTYRRGSLLRILLIALVTFFGLCVYYLTLNTTGLLCALIGLVASLFCVPSEKRLRAELSIDA